MLPKADIVYDEFHVLQHAADAIDEVRRHEFFRAGPTMRAMGRGKRWLLLRRWRHLSLAERGVLRALFAINRRLFKAYVLREQLARLWEYATPIGVGRFVVGWLKALRWQRLPEMEQLGHLLVDHLEGIAAYCIHRVPFGLVESLNTTIKGVIRRARGMQDETMLLLKLKWATARPIRFSRDLAKFLNLALYSNR
jgi:transposase